MDEQTNNQQYGTPEPAQPAPGPAQPVPGGAPAWPPQPAQQAQQAGYNPADYGQQGQPPAYNPADYGQQPQQPQQPWQQGGYAQPPYQQPAQPYQQPQQQPQQPYAAADYGQQQWQGQPGYAPGAYAQPAAAAQAPPPKKKGKGKLVVIIAAAVVVLAAAAVLLYLFLGRGDGGAAGNMRYTNPNRVFLDEDHRIYVVDAAGSVTDTGEEGLSAGIDTTGKRLVYTDEDDALYYYDLGSQKRELLADGDVFDFSLVMDDYALYQRVADPPTVDEVLQRAQQYDDWWTLEELEDMFYSSYDSPTLEDAVDFYYGWTGEDFLLLYSAYLVNLDTLEEQQLFNEKKAGEDYTFVYTSSDEAAQIVYLDDGGDLVLMEKNGTTTKLGSVPRGVRISIVGVPNSGQLVLWTVENGHYDDGGDDYEYTAYAWAGGKEVEVAYWDEYEYTYYQAQYSEKADQALVVGYKQEAVYVVANDGGVEKVKLGGNRVSSVRVARQGAEKPADFSSFYVQTYDDGDGATVYRINAARDREKIATGVSTLYAAITLGADSERVIYTNNSDALYTVDLAGGVPGDKEKISGNVYDVWASQDGSVLWYTKGSYDDNTLYRYTAADGNSEKMGDDCTVVRMTPDGASAFFISDAERYGDTYRRIGRLNVYQNGEVSKVADDVYTVYSVLKYGYADMDVVYFPADLYLDSDDYFYATLMGWDGSQKVKLADDIRL